MTVYIQKGCGIMFKDALAMLAFFTIGLGIGLYSK